MTAPDHPRTHERQPTVTKFDVKKMIRYLDEMLGDITSTPTVPVAPRAVPKLTTKTLDLIPSIPLTLDLIRANYHLTITDDEARDRMDTTLHECAHLVAAIACRSSILSVELYAPKATKRKPAGRAHTCELLREHEAFVSFAGYVWEEVHGEGHRAPADWEAGIRAANELGMPYQPFLDAAERFVIVDAAHAIRDAAVGVVCLMPRTGFLPGGRNSKLEKLTDWLKPKIPRFSMGSP